MKKMAAFIRGCFFLVCVVSLSLGVLEEPCNDEHTDCDQGECCAVLTGVHEGYKGECRLYHGMGQTCSFGGPKEGECGCRRGTICVGVSDGDEETVDTRCHVILPGRK